MRLLLATVLVCFSLSVFGGTVIENRDARGEISRVSIEGGWARFDGADKGKSGYMLVDLSSVTFYAVAPAEHTIIEFSPKEKKKDKQQAVKMDLEGAGKGPEVAGYETQIYKLSADGKSCGSILLSKSAAKIKDVSKLLGALRGLNPDTFIPEEMQQSFHAHRDPCDLAKTQLGEKAIVKLGFPMKSLDPKGKVIDEVVSIKTGIKLDSALFELPEEYSRTTVKEMMEGMRKEMEAARDKIEKMMEEMSPEERAKMEQMLKQFSNMPQ